jgi:hypothetical protein
VLKDLKELAQGHFGCAFSGARIHPGLGGERRCRLLQCGLLRGSFVPNLRCGYAGRGILTLSKLSRVEPQACFTLSLERSNSHSAAFFFKGPFCASHFSRLHQVNGKGPKGARYHRQPPILDETRLGCPGNEPSPCGQCAHHQPVAAHQGAKDARW